MEPETIDYGLELSPALQASLPRLVQAAGEIIAQWKGRASPPGQP
jgi:Ni,Fe-hydrogenase maturation factor